MMHFFFICEWLLWFKIWWWMTSQNGYTNFYRINSDFKTWFCTMWRLLTNTPHRVFISSDSNIRVICWDYMYSTHVSHFLLWWQIPSQEAGCITRSNDYFSPPRNLSSWIVSKSDAALVAILHHICCVMCVYGCHILNLPRICYEYAFGNLSSQDCRSH